MLDSPVTYTPGGAGLPGNIHTGGGAGLPGNIHTGVLDYTVTYTPGGAGLCDFAVDFPGSCGVLVTGKQDTNSFKI